LDESSEERGPLLASAMLEMMVEERPQSASMLVRLPEWDRHFPVYTLWRTAVSAFLLPPAWTDLYDDDAERLPAEGTVVVPEWFERPPDFRPFSNGACSGGGAGSSAEVCDSDSEGCARPVVGSGEEVGDATPDLPVCLHKAAVARARAAAAAAAAAGTSGAVNGSNGAWYAATPPREERPHVLTTPSPPAKPETDTPTAAFPPVAAPVALACADAAALAAAGTVEVVVGTKPFAHVSPQRVGTEELEKQTCPPVVPPREEVAAEITMLLDKVQHEVVVGTKPFAHVSPQRVGTEELEKQTCPPVVPPREEVAAEITMLLDKAHHPLRRSDFDTGVRQQLHATHHLGGRAVVHRALEGVAEVVEGLQSQGSAEAFAGGRRRPRQRWRPDLELGDRRHLSKHRGDGDRALRGERA